MIYRLKRIWQNDSGDIEDITEIFFKTEKEAQNYKNNDKEFTFKYSYIEELEFNKLI